MSVRGSSNGTAIPKTTRHQLGFRVSRKTCPIDCPVKGGQTVHSHVAKLLIGYARCSTDEQDLTAQTEALGSLGVNAKRIYVDHGLTGTNRDRPGLREALAACGAGDTLVVTELDRGARSLPDARNIVDELTARDIKLNLGGSVHDPTEPVGRLLFNVLAMVAEFESGTQSATPRPGTASGVLGPIARRRNPFVWLGTFPFQGSPRVGRVQLRRDCPCEC
jgi:Resolvase, N terminal domain